MDRIDYRLGQVEALWIARRRFGHSAPSFSAVAPRLTPEARVLLRAQRGLIADWQAASVGLTRRRLQRATSDGWCRISPHVFADRDVDPSPDQLRVAGVLEAGPGSALAGCSALVESGWRGSELGVVDVHTSRGRRHRSGPRPRWLRLHHPREEPRVGGEPRRTSVARAVLDAASWARSDREAVMVLASSVQQGLVIPRQLAKELARGPRRRAAVIRDVLADVGDGAASSNEVAFLRECRRRGLPRPRMQTRRVRGSRRTDAEFHLPDGRLLIVEIDGIGHLDVASWTADITRHNELAVETGAMILRVTGWEVRNDPDPFFTMLMTLVNGGW